MREAARRHRTAALLLSVALFLAVEILLRGAPPELVGKTNGESQKASKTGENDLSRSLAEEEASYARGGETYFQLCHVCHGQDGRGAPIVDDPEDRLMAPPLSGSRRVLGRPEYVITALLTGVTGPVDGENYQGLMVSMASYGDAWIADVATYVRNSFDNEASVITSNQVARVRQRLGGRTDPYTVEEILSLMPVPLTNQAKWKLTASHNSTKASYAITGGATNAWSSGAPQTAGMWFQIELPETVPLWDVNFASPARATLETSGFPRGYKVQVSIDGSQWSAPVAEGTGRGLYTLIHLEPVRAKVIRITLTSAPPDAPVWDINRTQILREGLPASTITRKAAPNPYE
jgi:mono/diheme cytochrome c family protein